MRAFLTVFFRLFLRVFYRRIAVVGAENVPATGGVIFAVNHPNGLVDPLLVLCFAPRPVSLLAKAPLFRYPLIGWFVRQLDSIPVFRKQDNVGGSNRETFSRARDLLASRGSIAIFPEGTTHSDSRLRELKTGAARIALGASGVAVAIVPTGIEYSAKHTFRSDAVVVFGEPIAVANGVVDADGEPAAAAVDALTERVRRGLDAVTLQADSRAALDLIGRAERIFSGAAGTAAEGLELRRRFVAGHHYLCAHAPARLAQLESMVVQFEVERDAANADPETLSSSSTGGALKSLAVVLVLFPIALAGAIVHYPAYRLVDALASRFAEGENEMTATMKFIASLLLYPLTWLAIAIFVWRWAGMPAAVAVLVILPLLGWIALRVLETIDVVIGRARSLTRRILRSHAYVRLAAQRKAIRDEFLRIAEEMDQAR